MSSSLAPLLFDESSYSIKEPGSTPEIGMGPLQKIYPTLGRLLRITRVYDDLRDPQPLKELCMTRFPSRPVLFLVLLCLASFSLVSAAPDSKLSAADWPQWRGPARDGVSK
jgi:hypothetical protein